MDSTTGIIPENLMYPQYKKEVISFLISQPLTGAAHGRSTTIWSR